MLDISWPFAREAYRSPPGQVIYAIGDVHGRADLLDALLDKIAIDAEFRAAEKTTLIFLGDYIDRGAQSRQVIERLLNVSDIGDEWRFLRGNHEAALLDFLEQPETGRSWIAIGGGETLYSYGIRAPRPDAPSAEWTAAARALRSQLGPAHLAFLQQLETFVQFGDYVFVHAGIRPGRPLARQTEADMLEIREPFLTSKRSGPFVVVHGHSPVSAASRLPGRIALDTGAFATGKLSAACIHDEEVSFLVTGAVEQRARLTEKTYSFATE